MQKWLFVGTAESQLEETEMAHQSEEAEEDVEKRGGRRKSAYGHTAVQQIIIGFVRQHLLCQHSSRQPRGGWTKNRLQSSEAKTDRNEVRCRKTKHLDQLGQFKVQPHVQVDRWADFIWVTSSNPVSLTRSDSPQADHDLWPHHSVLEMFPAVIMKQTFASLQLVWAFLHGLNCPWTM